MKQTAHNLIPEIPNPSPDYYCTWQTQLYATSDGKPAAQRRCIGEEALFGTEPTFGWSRFYPDARQDLLFVMDDSWDVPPDGDSTYFGSLVLDPEKFPAAAAAGKDSNAAALRCLCSRIRAAGWKGLGGWVCAQESERLRGGTAPEDYWRLRLEEAAESGFAYWKVDWGHRAGDADFRRRLTDLGHKIAPGLTVEHAILPEVLPHSDVFRTYDVPAILSIPMTMRKLAELLPVRQPDPGCAELINCEDEAYLAAAGGFVMGIMRHPFAGAFPDGRADMSFPALHRNLKTKLCEVTRAVRWHRIAPAFAAGAVPVFVDSATLTDSWQFCDIASEIEAWWLTNPLLGELRDNTAAITAPARISRGCPLPDLTPDANGDLPFAVAARNPNGACSIATLGRTVGRDYRIPRCDAALEIGDAHTIAAFGDYRSLTLRTTSAPGSVFLQDLAGSTAYDVTADVTRADGRIVIPGELIRQIGTEAQPAGDTSEPGVLIRLFR